MSAQVSLTRPTTVQQSQNRRSAFVPPPRFQQLRAADQLQQHYSKLRYSYTDQGEDNQPVSMAPATAPQRPTMPNQNHSRTSSFFSFRNKQAVDATVDAQTNSRHQHSAPTDETTTSISSTSPRPPASTPMQARPQQQQRPANNTNSNSTLVRGGSQSNSNTQPAPPPLHPEIRSVVQLTVAHAHKIYFSGPLVRRIERQPDGQRPGKDEGWTEVWAQLGGTTLSVWDMKEIQEASKQGKEVPPSYVNVTDAFVQVLGSVTVPATSSSPAKRYTNVLTLNTAGSNLLLFSCPSTASLISWAAALRLSAWEKSRLEEIYTAHLIRITISARDSPTTLIRGQMEGWVQIRVAGQTDWKRVWMVVSSGADTASKMEKNGDNAGNGIGAAPAPMATQKKKRMSSLFSRETSPIHAPLPSKPLVAIYLSNKPKDKKKALLTMTGITQAFSVYPERPELISRSTLIKLEGTLGDEELAGTMRSREAWVLVMPELEGGMGQAPEMLKWVVSFHDAFSMYGRPKAWTWDPRDPDSLMFAYPVGPHKDLLFLDRELVESLDPRDDRTSAIRSRLLGILLERMRGNDDRPSTQTSPARSAGAGPSQTPGAPGTPGPQLPPLSFDRAAGSPERNLLTPITEASHLPHAGRSSSSSLSKRTEAAPAPVPTPVPAPTPTPASPPPPRSVTPPIANIVNKSVNPRTDTSKPSEMNGTSNSTPSALRNSMLDPDMSSPHSASPASPPTAIPPSAWNLNANSFRTRASVGEDPRFSHDTVSLADNMSILTSPYSNAGHRETNRFGSISGLSSMNGTLASPSTQSVFTRITDFAQEPGALYYLNQDSPAPGPDDNPPDDNIDLLQKSEPSFKHEPAPEQQKPEGQEDDGVSIGSRPPDSPISPTPPDFSSNRPFSTRQNPPVTSLERKTSERTSGSSSQQSQSATTSNPADRLSPTLRAGLGRKPSGARAPTAHRVFNGDVISSSHQLTEEDELQEDMNMVKGKESEKPPGPTASASHDEQSHNEEALAVLSYLDIYDDDGSAAPPTNRLIVSSPSIMSNLTSSPALSPPQSATEPSESQFKSSFAPSKQAAERKAKAQAQQAAHQAAAHKPGRVDGQRKSKGGNGTWHESSDEDSEEGESDDDDDDDADSDVTPATAALPNHNTGQNQVPANSTNKPPHQGQLQTLEPQHSGSGQHQRPPRTLPQIPGRQLDENQSQFNRRMVPDQFAESVRRTHYDDGTPIRTQAEVPRPGAARQTVWSQVLDPGRGTLGESQHPSKDTFVTLEPAETMTKAFTPQGLLSAGLQDKEDRSAKRQEELARGTGASLINVPNKPPPPQTGLLGAITAHERERKRDGGVGAALTEREREKRLVEERQRRFDDQQRQQLDQMQQGGSMYGGQFGGYNPMMANPMMMGMMGMNPMMTGGGMNPMMTGGGLSPIAPMMTGQMGQMGQMGQVGQMGFPGMMPGYNPQHMFAAQQAAQAYQQAMMAFSVAGSQAGEGAGGPSQPLMPNMTGGNMAAFDPRMSMMGMPMMGGPQMGGLQMGGPLGMQMTGMSSFDPRFSPAHTPTNIGDPGLLPPNTMAPGQYSPRNSSPRHGSPLGPSAENGDSGRVSRASTPNNPPK